MTSFRQRQARQKKQREKEKKEKEKEEEEGEERMLAAASKTKAERKTGRTSSSSFDVSIAKSVRRCLHLEHVLERQGEGDSARDETEHGVSGVQTTGTGRRRCENRRPGSDAKSSSNFFDSARFDLARERGPPLVPCRPSSSM